MELILIDIYPALHNRTAASFDPPGEGGEVPDQTKGEQERVGGTNRMGLRDYVSR